MLPRTSLGHRMGILICLRRRAGQSIRASCLCAFSIQCDGWPVCLGLGRRRPPWPRTTLSWAGGNSPSPAGRPAGWAWRRSMASLQASLLWGGGSVVPLESQGGGRQARADAQARRSSARRQGQGHQGRQHRDDHRHWRWRRAEAHHGKPRENGRGEDKAEFTGRREPPMPPAPDLSQVKFGAPIRLFNGKDLTGWRLTDPKALSGWSVKDGLLVNDVHARGRQAAQALRQPAHRPGLRGLQPHAGNPRAAKGGNSGVYIRGIYEVQVVDSYGKPLDPHNMGAIYSRIKPTVARREARRGMADDGHHFRGPPCDGHPERHEDH